MATYALILSILLLSCFTVFGADLDVVPQILPPHPHHGGSHYPSMAPVHSPVHPPSHHHHHHGHPPAKSPVKPPTQAPVHPPSHSPVHPPTHHHHHGHPPAHAPVKPPTHAPVQPPAHAPGHPPHVPFLRSFISVQGVVYCKSCKYTGYTLNGAIAMANATIKLECNNTKSRQVKTAKTDKNGYFFVEAPATVTNYGAHKCKVSLVSSPNTACSKKSALHGGVDGAALRPIKAYMSGKKPFVLFTVGPFAFEPKCPPS